MIEQIHNMFYYDIFGVVVPSDTFMVHELSLVLTYVVLGLFLALVYKLLVGAISKLLWF